MRICRRFKPLSGGHFGELGDEIYVLRRRSVPGSVKTWPLSRGFNPASPGRPERLLSRLREVQAPVDPFVPASTPFSRYKGEGVAAEKNAAPT